jgi:ribonucleoside-triphosphate reductase
MQGIDFLSEFIYKSKYAKYLKDKQRRENWGETVDRIKGMMSRKYGHIESVLPDIDFAYDMLLQEKILGSQRAMQFGGTPIEQKNARIYNCSYSPINRPRFFAEYFWLLLAGSGCGFSVQNHHIAYLPNIYKPEGDEAVFVVPDTIEGWADCISVLLTSYFRIAIEDRFKQYIGKRVVFDFSKIRRKNSPLSYGGKAPGASGLKASLHKITSLIEKLISHGFERLRSIDAYDICMHLSDAVLSGGVRRSSTLCLFSKDDSLMLSAKTGNWMKNNPQRARSNNSVILLRGDTTREEFNEIIQSTKEFGEPGFVFTDDLECGYNPCVEINLYPYLIVNKELYNNFMKLYDNKGILDYKSAGLEVGWQTCNLSTINGKLVKTKEDFFQAIRAATIVGTLQAGFTDMGYLGEVSKKICEREALLGVSITGIMENPHIFLNADIVSEGAGLVKQINKEVAKKIGINPAARTTAVKPEGTGSIKLKTLANGIHAYHSRRFIRVCQTNKTEVPYQYLKSHLSDIAIEESVWSSDKTDDVLYFPITVSKEAKIKADFNAIEFLKVVKFFQKHWVHNGKNEDLCVVKSLSHNVSNTCLVNPEEWDDVKDFIYDNREFFCAVSLLGNYGDKDYYQAPFQAVFTESEIIDVYGDIGYEQCLQYYNTLRPIKSVQLWKLCESPTWNTPPNKEMAELTEKYFDGNYIKFQYCLKDIHNMILFEQLDNMYKNIVVDYDKMIEKDDNTQLSNEVACSGGACTI